MKCPNCQSSDWKNVDEFRFKDKDEKGTPIGMSMCNSCGFVSYPEKYQTKDEIIAHYRKAYRKPPSVVNMFTGQRKNHFHYAFLKDLIEEWQKSDAKPDIVEIGAAFGMSLNMFQQLIPSANISGTELTTAYKNVARHEFGIKLDDDFDDSKKYDLIMSYKVLEHQLDPHIELARYAKALKPEGFLYISVPTWFGPMVNFGLDGFDLDYYYEPNHINVWSKQMFESMLKIAGLEIVKTDFKMYGDTYLCKANAAMSVNQEPYYESTEIRLKQLADIKKAFELFVDQKYSEAVKVWPDFPSAHSSDIEMKRKMLAQMPWEQFEKDVLGPAVKSCPDSVELLITCADFALRARNFDRCINLTRKCLELKPNNPASLFQAATAFEQMAVHAKNKEEKNTFLQRSKETYFHLMNVSEQNKHECISKIYHINAHLDV